jgi:hypothetical protein
MCREKCNQNLSTELRCGVHVFVSVCVCVCVCGSYKSSENKEKISKAALFSDFTGSRLVVLIYIAAEP